MFCVVITEILAAWAPVNEELPLLRSILDPIKAHIDGFGAFLLDGIVGKTDGGGVVDLHWGRRLWMPEFGECGSNRDGLLSIDVGGANFGFGCGAHYVAENL